MSKPLFRVVSALALAAFLLPCAVSVCAAGYAAFDVYVVPATMRVPRDKDVRWDVNWAGPCPWPAEKMLQCPETRAKKITLFAACREWEPFQVVLRAAGGPVRNINATVTDLKGPEGHILSADRITLFREYYLYVLQPGAGHWFPRIEYPDPLLPFQDPFSKTQQWYGVPFNNTRIGTAGKPYRKDCAAGPANLFTAGAYTGQGDRRYVAQIDTAGNAGQGATFRWSDSWQAGLDAEASTVVSATNAHQRGVERWNAAKVAIPAFGADGKTALIPLNYGVAVRFAAGVKKSGKLDFEREHTFHFNAYEAMNEVIWGDVFVPADTVPGCYKGALTVTADGRKPVILPIELTVWNFTLPLTNSVVTAFNTGGGWPVELLLHNHRIDVQRVGGARINVDKFLAGDSNAVNWSTFDREVEKRLSGAAYPDGRPMNMFGLGYPIGAEGWNWDYWVKKNVSNVVLYARAEARHLKEKGWFDRVYKYCQDEPSPEGMVNIARDIREYLKADPDWNGKFMAVTSPNNYTSEMGPLINIWCPKFHWDIKPEALDFMRKHGQKMWCYVACSPYPPVPHYGIDTLRGYEPRLIKWASWELEARGFLYWMMYQATAQPNQWTTAMSLYGANGDGNFIYPGKRADASLPLRSVGGPLPGFRLKQIREGLEDWEYLIMHEHLQGREATMALAREVYRSPGGAYGQPVAPADLDKAWTQDANKIYEIRAKLAAGILSGRK